jgi:RNA polymerase sigma factor (TIGR02999 family)
MEARNETPKLPEPAIETEAQAAQELLPLVYEELRKLAAARMVGQWETSTLQPTALVHEAWLRLAGNKEQPWENRAHFFAAAAEAMRRILIDHARRKHAGKRRPGTQRVDLSQVDVAVQANDELLLRIDEALERLRQEDEEAAKLVKLRFFVGLDYEEAAKVLDISERTAKRHWTFARAWLFRELSTPTPQE